MSYMGNLKAEKIIVGLFRIILYVFYQFSYKRALFPELIYNDQTLDFVLFGVFFFFWSFFLGPHPQHMEVPRLGVKSK